MFHLIPIMDRVDFRQYLALLDPIIRIEIEANDAT
jgi:hypothetical protein